MPRTKIKKPVKRTVVKKEKTKTIAKAVKTTKTKKPIELRVKPIAKEEFSFYGFTLTNVIAIIIFLCLAGLAGYLIDRYKPNKEIKSVQAVSFLCQADRTPLDLLKERADIATEDTTFGVFVSEINGVSNSEKYYWLLYINNEIASSGADQYKCQEGDKIEWRYEKLF